MVEITNPMEGFLQGRQLREIERSNRATEEARMMEQERLRRAAELELTKFLQLNEDAQRLSEAYGVPAAGVRNPQFLTEMRQQQDFEQKRRAEGQGVLAALAPQYGAAMVQGMAPEQFVQNPNVANALRLAGYTPQETQEIIRTPNMFSNMLSSAVQGVRAAQALEPPDYTTPQEAVINGRPGFFTINQATGQPTIIPGMAPYNKPSSTLSNEDFTNRRVIQAVLADANDFLTLSRTQNTQASAAANTINRLLANDAGLKGVFGLPRVGDVIQSGGFGALSNLVVPSSAAATAVNDLQQLSSQAFIQSIKDIEGAAPISNIEGEKASGSLIALSRVISAEEARRVLTEFRQRLALQLEKNAQLRDVALQVTANPNAGPTLIQRYLELRNPAPPRIDEAPMPGAGAPPAATTTQAPPDYTYQNGRLVPNR